MIELQLLWHDVEVEGDESVLASLAPLLAHPAHPMRPLASMSYHVTQSAGGGFEILEEGDLLVNAATVIDARDAIYVRMHRRAFEFASLAGWVRVHAATVDLDGRRVLLAGPSGSGKSTLALALLAAGVDVHGDESVLVRSGASIAVPRPFQPEDRVRELVPELQSALDAGVLLDEVRVVDRALVGPPWVLTDRPVAYVLALERGEGDPQVEPLSPMELLELLARDSFLVSESRAALIGTLTSVARHGGHRLVTGDLGSTIAEIRRVAH